MTSQLRELCGDLEDESVFRDETNLMALRHRLEPAVDEAERAIESATAPLRLEIDKWFKARGELRLEVARLLRQRRELRTALARLVKAVDRLPMDVPVGSGLGQSRVAAAKLLADQPGGDS